MIIWADLSNTWVLFLYRNIHLPRSLPHFHGYSYATSAGGPTAQFTCAALPQTYLSLSIYWNNDWRETVFDGFSGSVALQRILILRSLPQELARSKDMKEMIWNDTKLSSLFPPQSSRHTGATICMLQKILAIGLRLSVRIRRRSRGPSRRLARLLRKIFKSMALQLLRVCTAMVHRAEEHRIWWFLSIQNPDPSSSILQRICFFIMFVPAFQREFHGSKE